MTHIPVHHPRTLDEIAPLAPDFVACVQAEEEAREEAEREAQFRYYEQLAAEASRFPLASHARAGTYRHALQNALVGAREDREPYVVYRDAEGHHHHELAAFRTQIEQEGGVLIATVEPGARL